MKGFCPTLAVVITTHNRASLLANRSLASVAAQTRRADLVVIADDSNEENWQRNQKTVSDFVNRTGIPTTHFGKQRNFRNIKKAIAPPGGFAHRSHACNRNAAVLTVLAHGCNPHNTWVAVLDDDDEWLPLHLAQAETTIACAGKRGIDFLPAAHYWSNPNRALRKRFLPNFNGRDFLVGNPGVNGSTLIIRLATLLRAGMFDEALPSCDDRDICARLSMLPSLRYRQPPEPSVVYHNDARMRITRKRGVAKIEGLARFADKYRGWMSDAEYSAFTQRAEKLFNWDGDQPRLAPHIAKHSRASAAPAVHVARDQIALVCGVIVHPTQNNHQLFTDLQQLAQDARLSSLDVVVIPASAKDFRIFQSKIARWRVADLRVYCISNARARAVMRELAIVANARQRSIAVNRTILQYAMACVVKDYRNPVGWVLDDDTQLHGLQMRAGRMQKIKPDYVGEMLRLRALGYDLALSSVNGAPPLPRAFNVRTQLVDMLNFLLCLQRLPAQRHFPKLTIANFPHTQIAADYYHDCGDHPHLEQPAGIPPLPHNCSVSRFVRKLPNLLTRILAGDAVTRPVLSGMANDGRKYLPRGGNTLFLNRTILNALPNGLASGAFSTARRQDEVWRIVGERALGWKVGMGDFVVTQTRANDTPSAPDMKRLEMDVIGHAICDALCACGQKKGGGVAQWIDFVLRNEDEFFARVQKATRIRMNMVCQSFFRIGGIAESMRGLIAPVKDSTDKSAALRALHNLERKFAHVRFQALEKRVNVQLQQRQLRAALINFTQLCQQPHDQPAWTTWLRGELADNAKLLLAQLTSAKKPSRLLGQGGEGTVFTDERRVYKVLHRWYSRGRVPFDDLIPRLLGEWNPQKNIAYPLLDFYRNGGDAVLVMPFEKTTPYRGGYGPGLVALLADFKERGLVLWNFAPRNLRRAGNAVRFVDYGREIHSFTQKDFDLCMRKVWLCWRFGMRKDLPALLTASLTNARLPELAGYELMRQAALQYATRARAADTVRETVLRARPLRVLDYGCGRGQDACALQEHGISVTAYDPNLSDATRRKLRGAGVQVQAVAQLRGAEPFDMILLRHVVCEIRAEKELRACLNNLHRLCKPYGAVWVTACDMDCAVKHKTYAINFLPRNADGGRKFFYRKQVRLTGAIRAHVHRPSEILHQEFRRAGFNVVSRHAFAEINLVSFESCGGVLQWKLMPVAD